MAQPPLPSLLAPGAKARNLDLAALLAIASHEGASGRIGDNGHAFGPFQLNDAGGVLTGKLGGMTPEQKNAWAWSPAGINYAEDGIAKVAAGQHGAQAINSIASKFERPANVQAEIQDALAHYGKGAGTFAATLPVGRPPTPGAAPNMAGGSLLGSLIGSTNELVGLGANPTLASLLSGSAAAKPAGGAPAQRPAAAAEGKPGHLVTIDGVTVDSAVAPMLQQVVSRFGVKPTSGYRDPGHNSQVGGASNSDHLRGDAVDFGGDPQALAALYKYAQGRYPYVEPMAQAKDHVHISFRRP